MSRKSYPVRIPRYAAGIRAQESRTGAGRSWWAKEWARRLEAMGLRGRLGRGKNYAVSGQVVSMEISGNRVLAQVQGTRPEPYAVTVTFRQPEGETRSRIVAALRGEPIFREAGCDLFPGGKLGPGKYDMTTACSCPDYANPCKHSAAALLILGEEIARRPATLVELRGIALEELYDED